MTGLIWGFIKSIDAILLGNTGVKLGAGRAMASDKISFEVGFRLLKTIGQQIVQGIIFYYWILTNQPKFKNNYLLIDEPWLEVFHNSEVFDNAYNDLLANSIEIIESSFQVESLIIKIIDLE